jgi:hypothetical protein
MDNNIKTICFLYLGLATGTFYIQTYIDGRKSLIRKRAEKIQSNITDDNKYWKQYNEIDITECGCKKYIFRRLFMSLLFPVTWTTSIIPHIVHVMNPAE